MSSIPPSLLLLLLLLTTFLLHRHTTTAAAAQSPAVACKSSVYPKLCRAILAPLRFPSTPYDYGRYSVRQAMKQARRTSLMLDRYLVRVSPFRGGALEDCRDLAALNADYLEAVQAELGQGDSVLSATGVDRVKALMSAVVTNHQTCFDGLQASRTTLPELSLIVSNSTALFGVSLELVTSALQRRSTGGGRSEKRTGVGAGPVGSGFGFGSTKQAGGSPSPPTGRGLVEEEGVVVPVNKSVTVAKDGSGNFTSIGDAVAFAPNGTSIDDGYLVIFIGEGVYEENILIPKNKKNVKLIGAGANRTVITGNRSYVDGWTTYNSATVAVHGDRFIAMDITFENTAGPEKHQAVAVRTSADLSSFYRCRFLGYQDTLYVHSFRQFYRDCDIYGTVDFIFGNAAVVFQNCNLYARKPLPNQFNAITAQGRTHLNQTTGISIHNCTIRAAPDLGAEANSTRTFLGRPWKEFSRTVYMQSFIDSVIEPVGWMEWNGSFALSTLYYGEFDNYGPGANTSSRVQWPGYSLMNATEAFNFTVTNFTTGDAWLPSTSIPHAGGLL